MLRVEQFEELTAWQDAKEVVKAVYALSLVGPLAKDFGLRDPLRRAAVSTMSNVVERFERGTNNEFVHYLQIAKGSAGEVRSLLYVTLELGYLTETNVATLQTLCTTVSRRLSTFINYLQSAKSSPLTGPRDARQPDNLKLDNSPSFRE